MLLVGTFAEAGGLTSKELKALHERSTGLLSTVKATVANYNLIRQLGSTLRPDELTEAAVLKGEFPWAFRTGDALQGMLTV
jgi:hypothetical protein